MAKNAFQGRFFQGSLRTLITRDVPRTTHDRRPKESDGSIRGQIG
jgi:hypothetical protein